MVENENSLELEDGECSSSDEDGEKCDVDNEDATSTSTATDDGKLREYLQKILLFQCWIINKNIKELTAFCTVGTKNLLLGTNRCRKMEISSEICGFELESLNIF